MIILVLVLVPVLVPPVDVTMTQEPPPEIGCALNQTMRYIRVLKKEVIVSTTVRYCSTVPRTCCVKTDDPQAGSYAAWWCCVGGVAMSWSVGNWPDDLDTGNLLDGIRFPSNAKGKPLPLPNSLLYLCGVTTLMARPYFHRWSTCSVLNKNRRRSTDKGLSKPLWSLESRYWPSVFNSCGEHYVVDGSFSVLQPNKLNDVDAETIALGLRNNHVMRELVL
jgi:hypothetical protein